MTIINNISHRGDNLLTQNQETPKILTRVKWLRVALISLVLLCVLEIWITSRLATYGTKVQEIQQATARLTLENQILESKIAEKSSLANLEKTASVYGFAPMKNFDYITPQKLAAK
ncbi:hypothetical protein M1563_01750 [Patescibacteria group bacterium]|nr:hypothetical protein [Patescibacteria group bacterium]MCL5410098.1 hypothetical protein [Patescibacteria group bacterium]